MYPFVLTVYILAAFLTGLVPIVDLQATTRVTIYLVFAVVVLFPPGLYFLETKKDIGKCLLIPITSVAVLLFTVLIDFVLWP